MRNILVFSISFLLLAACGAWKLTPEEKLARTQQVKHNVEAGDYIIEANQMRPLRGKIINLSSSYDLVVRNDSAIAYLPFFGRAIQAPFPGSDAGIKFAERMDDYKITSLSNDSGWLVKFDINTREYNYNFRIEISDTGEATVDIGSIQRDPISFLGELRWTSVMK